MNAAQLQQGVDALACYNTAIAILQREIPSSLDAEAAAELRRSVATAFASIAVSRASNYNKILVVNLICLPLGALHD